MENNAYSSIYNWENVFLSVLFPTDKNLELNT